MSDSDESPQCAECGYIGEMDETENPEHLWGVVGSTTTLCPDCHAIQEDIFG
jgi:hypothetical protein